MLRWVSYPVTVVVIILNIWEKNIRKIVGTKFKSELRNTRLIFLHTYLKKSYPATSLVSKLFYARIPRFPLTRISTYADFSLCTH